MVISYYKHTSDLEWEPYIWIPWKMPFLSFFGPKQNRKGHHQNRVLCRLSELDIWNDAYMIILPLLDLPLL